MNVDVLFNPKKVTFCGIKTWQTWTALYMLERILWKDRDIKRVVELGTARGGLALFMGVHLKLRDGMLLTLDVRRLVDNKWIEQASRFNVKFEQKDVFDSETVEEVRGFISNHRTLIFCDNGDKPRELQTYSKILKPNDLIMAHDWGKEIKREDLTAEILSILEPYRQEDFDSLKTRILSMRRKL